MSYSTSGSNVLISDARIEKGERLADDEANPLDDGKVKALFVAVQDNMLKALTDENGHIRQKAFSYWSDETKLGENTVCMNLCRRLFAP